VELPDGTTLMHGRTPYDPKKAHDYYLRTRELKGRKKGRVDPKVADLAMRLKGKSDAEIRLEAKNAKDPAERRMINVMLTNRQRIQGKAGSKRNVDPKVLAQQRQHAAARVASLRTELADLNKKLKDAVAKQRKSKAKEKRGPTVAEKSKAARESKKFRDKHKQKLSNKRQHSSKKSTSARTRSSSVESLTKQVRETKGRLDAAIKKQKSLG
jgi:hypothetical protein